MDMVDVDDEEIANIARDGEVKEIEIDDLRTSVGMAKRKFPDIKIMPDIKKGVPLLQ